VGAYNTTTPAVLYTDGHYISGDNQSIIPGLTPTHKFIGSTLTTEGKRI